MAGGERNHHGIDYIEFPLADVAATKAFYGAVFGWAFQDWGPDYLSFSGSPDPRAALG